MNIEHELEALARDADRELEAVVEHVRRLDSQITERTTALDRLRAAIPELDERAATELAEGTTPTRHVAALRKATDEIRDREGELTLLRAAQATAQRRAADRQARYVERLEQRLEPLFVETISKIDAHLEQAERLNAQLGTLHDAAIRHLGPLHGLAQGYCFFGLGGWRARVAGFVRKARAA